MYKYILHTNKKRKEETMTDKTSTQTKALNLYNKLALIGEPVKIMKKTKKGYNYTYVPEEELLAGIQSGMEKYNVSLIPSIVPGSTKHTTRDYSKTKFSKDGKSYEERVNEIVVEGELCFTWVNNDNPSETIECPWYFIGQQSDSSQAFGSGLTYASRYFKLQYFQVATSNDPDALVAKKKEREMQEELEIVKDILGKIDELCVSYTEQHKDKRDDLIAIIQKHHTSANYKTIKSVKIASDVLTELKKYTEENK